MKDTLEYLRGQRQVKMSIIAGNVATPNGASDVYSWGADIVKVGCGPGSACTTRVVTGVGIPQLSALLHIARLGIPFIADGGIRSSGDAAKAICAGATAIMIGGLLSGTDMVPNWEDPGEEFMKVVPFRGMASREAKEDLGLVDAYREGEAAQVRCKPEGSTLAVVAEIVDGLRSSMAYVGARTIDEFHDRGTFVRTTSSVLHENASRIMELF